ncbi:hypothetical protein [Pseudomonas sp.]|jgi:hypothetical protein|uniref:hypothetical protein n=1 Tax=Pseudomonas sp. TaxID=306 RepID=UPI002ED80B27
MHEIKIIRTDRVLGFDDDIVEVHVNDTKRKIRNGESLVVLEEIPADVQIFARGKQTWEGTVLAKKDGSATVYASITEAIAAREGWTDTKKTPVQLVKPDQPVGPVLSARAVRIKAVMDSNASWMKENKQIAYTCYGFSVIPAILAVCALAQRSPGWAFICGIVFVAAILLGVCAYFRQPGKCPKCEAPTLTRTDYNESFMGTRSVQRVIRNQVTNQDEQRTVTVSDIQVIEDWLCVTCDHAWKYKHSYVSE